MSSKQNFKKPEGWFNFFKFFKALFNFTLIEKINPLSRGNIFPVGNLITNCNEAPPCRRFTPRSKKKWMMEAFLRPSFSSIISCLLKSDWTFSPIFSPFSLQIRTERTRNHVCAAVNHFTNLTSCYFTRFAINFGLFLKFSKNISTQQHFPLRRLATTADFSSEFHFRDHILSEKIKTQGLGRAARGKLFSPEMLFSWDLLKSTLQKRNDRMDTRVSTLS